MKTHSIVGRVFWMLYACPLMLLFLACEAFAIWEYGPKVAPWSGLDFVISLPGLVALFLHIWDTKLFVQPFWKIYSFVIVAWDLLFNLFIQPVITGEPLEPGAAIGFIIFLPLYVAIFRYAFRNWDGMVD